MTAPETEARQEKERLAALLGERGFTPKVRDVVALAALYAEVDAELTSRVDVAIARVGERALRPLVTAFNSFGPRVRASVVRVLSKLVGPEVRAFLLRALRDDDPKTRRNAIIALGRYPDAEVEGALIAVLADMPPVEQKRSLAASLGKVGGDAARVALLACDELDPEFVRIREKALLMLDRTLLRPAASTVDLTRAPSSPLLVNLHCRRGLEDFVAEELGGGTSHGR